MLKSLFQSKSFSNIIASSSARISSSIISLLTVPLLLNIMGIKTYGTWVTITALLGWISMFDFGIGYSLKNKVTEFSAIGKRDDIQKLFMGTLQFYAIASILIFIVFLLSLFFVSVFFENKILTILIYLPVITAYPLTLSNFIMQGSRHFKLLYFILLGQSLLWLTVLLLVKVAVLPKNIYLLGALYGLIYLFIYLTLFSVALKKLNLKVYDFFKFAILKEINHLILTGVRFFLLQLSSLFLFSLGNYLTYNNLNPESVSKFDTVNKVFLLLISLFNIVLSVFWSDISHYKALKDKVRLKFTYKTLILINIVFDLLVVGAYFSLPFIINIWTKGLIKVTLKETYAFPILISIQSLAYCGAVFLNAFEDLKGQIVFAIIAAALIVPIVKIGFCYFNFGIGTVPLVSALLISPSVIFYLKKSYNRINTI